MWRWSEIKRWERIKHEADKPWGWLDEFEYRRGSASIVVHRLAVIHDDAELGDRCDIHQNVMIGPNAKIGCYVCIHDDARILANAKIGNRSNILSDVTIESGVEVEAGATVFRGSVIPFYESVTREKTKPGETRWRFREKRPRRWKGWSWRRVSIVSGIASAVCFIPVVVMYVPIDVLFPVAVLGVGLWLGTVITRGVV